MRDGLDDHLTVELWTIAAGPWISIWTVMIAIATAHMLIHSPATNNRWRTWTIVHSLHSYCYDVVFRKRKKVEINYREIRTDVITGGAVSQ